MSARKKIGFFFIWFGSNLIQYTPCFQADVIQLKWHFPWSFKEAFVHTDSCRDQHRSLKTAHARTLPEQLFCEIPSEQVQHCVTVRTKISVNPMWHFSQSLTSPEMLCGTACLLPCSNSPAAQVQAHGLKRGNKEVKQTSQWICLCSREKKAGRFLALHHRNRL